MVVKKDVRAPKHAEINVPNLQVMKALLSLKSRGYVSEQFSWQHYYYFLTDEGILLVAFLPPFARDRCSFDHLPRLLPLLLLVLNAMNVKIVLKVVVVVNTVVNGVTSLKPRCCCSLNGE